MKKLIYSLTIILAFFIGVIGTIWSFDKIVIKEDTVAKTVTIVENDTIKSAVDQVYEAVVMIESYKGDYINGTGTGFVYKKDDNKGYIITNNHVIEGSTSIKAIMINGNSVNATLLGSDEYSDIAVLSIDAKDVLKVAKIGDSTALELGDTLFTVGSPLGKEYMGTVTKGILSGKDRTVEVDLTNGQFMLDVLQTDAAINPGNSGGPLVNINGEVIGVNSLKLVKDTIEGMGFAIPIEIAMTSVDRLEKGEEVIRPVLGVSIIDATDSHSLYLNKVFLDKDFSNGVVIVKIENDTPAKKAGLQSNDVILEVDNIKINGVGHFRFLLYKYKIDDTITIKYYRDKKEHEVKVKLTKSLKDMQ